MRVLGIKTAPSELDWALLVGEDRATAAIADQERVRVPGGHERCEELAWLRKEVVGLIEKHHPDAVAVMTTEPGAQRISVQRAEVDGVVQEACGAAQQPIKKLLAVSVRSAFEVRKKAELEDALQRIPVLGEVAKSRQAPVVAALSVIGLP